MLPPPAPPDKSKEKCCICLSFRKCAHIRKHPEKGGTQLCGPIPICMPCSSELCVKFHGDKNLGSGQFICPICRASLGTKRRALEEGAEAIRWSVEADTPQVQWKPARESAMQRAMRERNIVELRRLWEVENPQGASTLAKSSPISGGESASSEQIREDAAIAACQRHMDEICGNSKAEEGESPQLNYHMGRRSRPKRRVASASPDRREQAEESNTSEITTDLQNVVAFGKDAEGPLEDDAGKSVEIHSSAPLGQAGSNLPDIPPKDGESCKRKDSQRSVASPCRGNFAKCNPARQKQMGKSSGLNQAAPIVRANLAEVGRDSLSGSFLSDIYAATVDCNLAHVSKSSRGSLALGQKVHSQASATEQADLSNSGAKVAASEKKADMEEMEGYVGEALQAENATDAAEPVIAPVKAAEEGNAGENAKAEPALQELAEAAKSRSQEVAEMVQAEEAAGKVEEEQKRKRDEAANRAEEENQRHKQDAARKEEERKPNQEEAGKRSEEDQKRQREEAARKEEEERKRKKEETAKRAEDERKQRREEAAWQEEEERKRRQEEAAKRSEEEKLQKEEAARKEEEERKRKQDEAAKRAEDERKQRRKEAARQEEEERKRRQEEAAERAEEEKQQKEEAARKEEEERKRKQDEAAKRAEDERKQRREEAARQEEEERKRRQREAAKRAEEEKQQQEEAARKEEEERKRKQDEAAKIVVDERKQQKEEAARQKEEEERKGKQAEAAKRSEEEKIQQKEQVARKEDEERKQKQEEAAKRSEEEKRQKEGAARKGEEEKRQQESSESHGSDCKPREQAAACKDGLSLLTRMKKRLQTTSSSISSADLLILQNESKPCGEKIGDKSITEHEILQKKGQTRRRVQPTILKDATQAWIEKPPHPVSIRAGREAVALSTSFEELAEEPPCVGSTAFKTRLLGVSSMKASDMMPTTHPEISGGDQRCQEPESAAVAAGSTTVPNLESQEVPGLQELDRAKLSTLLSPISGDVAMSCQDDEQVCLVAAGKPLTAALDRDFQEVPGSHEQAPTEASTSASPISNNVGPLAEAHHELSPVAAKETPTAVAPKKGHEVPGLKEQSKKNVPTSAGKALDSQATPDQVARCLKDARKLHLKSKQPHVHLRVKRGHRSRKSSSQSEHQVDTPARKPSVAQAAAHTWRIRTDVYAKKIVASGLLQLGGPETTFQVTSQHAGGSLQEAERIVKRCVQSIVGGASSEEWNRLRAQLCAAACCRVVSSPAVARLQHIPPVPALTATRRGEPKVRSPDVSSPAIAGKPWTPVQVCAAAKDNEALNAVAEARDARANLVEAQRLPTHVSPDSQSASPVECTATPAPARTKQCAVWDPYLESAAGLTSEALEDQQTEEVAHLPPESPHVQRQRPMEEPSTPVAELRSKAQRLRDLAWEAEEEARRQEDRQQRECQRLREQATRAEEEARRLADEGARAEEAARRLADEGTRKVIELRSKSKQLEEQASKVQSRVGLASVETKNTPVASCEAPLEETVQARRRSLQTGALQKLRKRKSARVSFSCSMSSQALLMRIKQRLRPAPPCRVEITAPLKDQQGFAAHSSSTCTSDFASGAASSAAGRATPARASAPHLSPDVSDSRVLSIVDLESPGGRSKGHSHVNLPRQAGEPQRCMDSNVYSENHNPNVWAQPLNISQQNADVDRKDGGTILLDNRDGPVWVDEVEEIVADPPQSSQSPLGWHSVLEGEEEVAKVGKRQAGCHELLAHVRSPAAGSKPMMTSNAEELEVLTMPESGACLRGGTSTAAPKSRDLPRKRPATGQPCSGKNKRRRLPSEREELRLLDAQTRPLAPPLVGPLQPRRKSAAGSRQASNKLIQSKAHRRSLAVSKASKKSKGSLPESACGAPSGKRPAEDTNYTRLRLLMQAYGH